ncbi:MAG: NAD(P)/FAD-dependent oxidoreductase [Chloroflexota bacterium]
MSQGGMESQRVLILGGGFAGLNTALKLEKLLARRADVQITLVNRDNYALFTPMLSEVAGGGIEPRHIVNPIRRFLKRTEFREGVVRGIDLQLQAVHLEHPQSHEPMSLGYDRLVVALGSVTNYRNLPGVADNAFALKTMADAQTVRDHVLSVLEQAELIEDPEERRCLLTFVIAGGGFSGAELCGAMESYIDRALRFYPSISLNEVRVLLVHPGPRLLPEVGPELAEYARKNLEERGVEVRLSTKVSQATNHSVTIGDGEEILTHTLVWTAGTSPCPVLDGVGCTRDQRGALVVNEYLEVPEYPGVFALGDCASIPDRRTGKAYPPTAQHAIREAAVAAHNVAASLGVGERKPFVFDTIGQLAVLGHNTAVAEIKRWRFSGFLAFWMWRTVYWLKLPSLERRVRVAVDWTMDLLFPPDTVQLGTGRNHADEQDHEGPEHDHDHSHHEAVSPPRGTHHALATPTADRSR